MAAKGRGKKKELAAQECPPGFKLRHTLRGHTGVICRIAWSPDGHTLASPSDDKTIRLWDANTGELRRELEGHSGSVYSVAWSPDGRKLASASQDKTVRLWDATTAELRDTLKGHSDQVWSLAWSPDGRTLASASQDKTVRLWDAATGEARNTLKGHNHVLSVVWSPDGRTLASAAYDNTVRLWDATTGEVRYTLEGHSSFVYSVAWSPDGRTLASAAYDNTVRLWDATTGRAVTVLEGHTAWMRSAAFSPDGRLLASNSSDGTVRLWRCDTWDTVAVLDEPASPAWSPSLAFHPTAPVLATLGRNDRVIRIWDLDLDVLLGPGAAVAVPSAQYTNAKVVLVGDTGVGKSGLGLVLSGQDFEATESTHGRHVWTSDRHEVEVPSGVRQTRETLLWDFAGQPGYRLIHRLHLHDVAVAAVVFDARSETDPFSGVDYWARAIDQATSGFPTVKLLVAARSDRGGPAASKKRIREVIKRLGFDAYIETSAKSGDGMDDLKQKIQDAIQWDKLPFVVTPQVFARLKDFLVEQKKQGRVLSSRDDLLAEYMEEHPDDGAAEDKFDTCLGLLQASGLIRRLSFNDLVLLQPEMLDNYCAWMAIGARKEPEGLGSIPEKKALAAKFTMDDDLRVEDKAMEPSMLLATIQEAVGRGIAYRQPTDKGDMLVFPSELKRDLPNYPGERTLAVAFHFDGPVSAIYATLAVRLVHTPAYTEPKLFKNAAEFKAVEGYICGFAVDYPDKYNDARGRLTAFFDGDTDRNVELLFLRYVNQQLDRLALDGTVVPERIYMCPHPKCDYQSPQDVVKARKELGENTVVCPIHMLHIPLDDLVEQAGQADEAVDELGVLSDEERKRQKRATIVKKRLELQQYHTFLCHNSKDKPEVRKLRKRLEHQGIAAWIDEKNILAGDQFVPAIEEILDQVPSALVIIGPNSTGRWQQQEYYALLQSYVEGRKDEGRPLRLIPVLLPTAEKRPRLPVFLRSFNYVDFRKGGLDDREEMRRLIRGILTEGRGLD